MWTSTNVTILGLIVFFGLLILALIRGEKKFDLSALYEGEIRKAIVIAFTAIYLIILPFYFFNVYIPNATSNTTTKIDTVNETENAGLRIFNLTNETSVPATAINDPLKNFLYIYILIIAFYFSSRVVDNYIKSKEGSEETLRKAYASGKISNQEFTGRMEKLAGASLQMRCAKEKISNEELTANMNNLTNVSGRMKDP